MKPKLIRKEKQASLFLSHSHYDAPVATAFARIIERVTSGQLRVWHSSDNSSNGGIGAGERWAETIRKKLKSCKAVVVLLSKESVSSPWILFESGFGASKPGVELIPVCVGLENLNSIPPPIALYQAFDITTADGATAFLRKLTFKFQLPFDEEVAQFLLVPLMKQIKNAIAKPAKERSDDLLRIMKGMQESLNNLHSGIQSVIGVDEGYPVKLCTYLPECISVGMLEIKKSETVRDKLNEIYGTYKRHFRAFSYLEEWILIEFSAGGYHPLISRDAGYDNVPAQKVFVKGSKWILALLKHPYTASSESILYNIRSASDSRQSRHAVNTGGEDGDERDTGFTLFRMRIVDPDAARRYRQRTGE